MPDHVSGSLPAPLAHDDLHQCAPKLDRLMALRDALVALNGPLASDPQRRENLRKRLLSAEVMTACWASAGLAPTSFNPFESTFFVFNLH
ncbi:hypothetical protein PFWH6_2760 [Pseudomonas fluorescens WH6]|nr:hypothetical protein PFWH6_2760 [Pseudomonas fluorescens WH6]